MVRFTTNWFRVLSTSWLTQPFLTLQAPCICLGRSSAVLLLLDSFSCFRRGPLCNQDEKKITAVNTSNCEMSQTFPLSSRWWLHDQAISDPNRQREKLTQTIAGTCKMARQGKALAAKPYYLGCIPSSPRVERVNWLPLVAFWSLHKHCANHEYSWNIPYFLFCFLSGAKATGLGPCPSSRSDGGHG